MATILEFRATELNSSPVSRAPRECSAEIVLFPGVRYERWSEEPQPEQPAPKARSRRHRDRIELTD